MFLGDEGSRMERIDGAIAESGRLSGRRPAPVKTFRTLGEDFSPGSWMGRTMSKVAGAGSTNYVALDLRYAGAPGPARRARAT